MSQPCNVASPSPMCKKTWLLTHVPNTSFLYTCSKPSNPLDNKQNVPIPQCCTPQYAL